jgi:peptide/nickel transport system permease protein
VTDPNMTLPVSTEVNAVAPAVEATTHVFVSEKRGKLGLLFWCSATYATLNILVAIFAGFLHLEDPQATPFSNSWAPPSASHLFGTDEIGRDIFSRVLYGSRISLEVGLGAIAIAFLAGGSLGMVAAYVRGKVDVVISSIMYTILAFPAIVLLIAILTFWQPASLYKIILVVGVAAIPLVYRVIRAATLSVATRDFVLAARVQGASNARIIFKELLPNIAATVLSFLLIGIAGVIALEGALAFLGVSVRPPTPSWGNMIAEGQSTLPQSEYLVGFASLAVCLFLLSLNFMGDRLRSYFDVTEVKL